MSSSSAERAMSQRRALRWSIAASFLLHFVGYASLAPAFPTKAPQRKTQLSFDVVEPPKPAAVPPKTESQPRSRPPHPRPAPARAPAPAPAPARAPAPPLPPTPEAPPAATSVGVTLASDASNAFAMPLGNGGALEPTRTPSLPPLNLPAPAKPTPGPQAMEPPVVAVGDLSARPSPPSLAALLERNYPSDARRRGLSGSAKVRARIDPDGVVRRIALLEESAAGFGAACSRTLNGSRWAAPKDKAGRPVATEIRYTCRFVVQP